MKQGAFTPTRHGYVRDDCTEDENGNWRDPEGRLIYQREGKGIPGSLVKVWYNEEMFWVDTRAHDGGAVGEILPRDDDDCEDMRVGTRSHVSFADPTFASAWGNIPRRHASRCGEFQAELYRRGLHRLQGMR